MKTLMESNDVHKIRKIQAESALRHRFTHLETGSIVMNLRPSHSRNKGNEDSDFLAKFEAQRASQSQIPDET